MTLDSSYDLQAAMVQAIRTDTDLNDLIGGRVFDRVPEYVDFPFVSFGPDFAQPINGTNTGESFEHIMTLDTWSRRDGRGETRKICSALISLLHNRPLALPSHTAVLFRLQDQRVLMDPDLVTAHGVQRWKVWTDE